MTEGYIVASGKSYLTRQLFWFPHDKPEDAYVFPEWQIKDVLELTEGWQITPTHIYKATYENGQVTVGELLSKE